MAKKPVMMQAVMRARQHRHIDAQVEEIERVDIGDEARQ